MGEKRSKCAVVSFGDIGIRSADLVAFPSKGEACCLSGFFQKKKFKKKKFKDRFPKFREGLTEFGKPVFSGH